MQKIWGVFLILIASSCNLIQVSEADKEKLAEDLRSTIDWAEVDDYPLFDDCDEGVNKVLQRACFESTIKNHLFNCLEAADLNIEEKIVDEVKVEFTINRLGVIKVEHIQQKPEIAAALPQLNKHIEDCLQTLPRVAPALKRNMEVDSKFVLPIIINIQ
jgi:hypothetical protein